MQPNENAKERKRSVYRIEFFFGRQNRKKNKIKYRLFSLSIPFVLVVFFYLVGCRVPVRSYYKDAYSIPTKQLHTNCDKMYFIYVHVVHPKIEWLSICESQWFRVRYIYWLKICVCARKGIKNEAMNSSFLLFSFFSLSFCPLFSYISWVFFLLFNSIPLSVVRLSLSVCMCTCRMYVCMYVHIWAHRFCCCYFSRIQSSIGMDEGKKKKTRFYFKRQRDGTKMSEKKKREKSNKIK